MRGNLTAVKPRKAMLRIGRCPNMVPGMYTDAELPRSLLMGYADNGQQFALGENPVGDFASMPAELGLD